MNPQQKVCCYITELIVAKSVGKLCTCKILGIKYSLGNLCTNVGLYINIIGNYLIMIYLRIYIKLKDLVLGAQIPKSW